MVKNYKDYSVLDGIIKNAGSELKTAFDKGYAQGVGNATNEYNALAIEAAKKSSARTEEEYEKGWIAGREDAISMVKWLFQHTPDKGLLDGDYVEDIINQHSIPEIQLAIGAYKERQEDDPVFYGDEVNGFDGERGIVIGCLDNYQKDKFRVFTGKQVEVWLREWFHKTGRHFDSITEEVTRDLIGGNANV